MNKSNLFLFIVLATLLACSNPVKAFLKLPLRRARTTTWSGQLHSNVTWQDQVIVTADVVVMPGVTLTILPGTTILFEPSKSSKIDAFYFSGATELIVRGRIIAQGTESQPILFSTTKKTKSAHDWAGIYFDSDDKQGSLIYNCRIEYAEQAIYVLKGAPLIKQNNMANCQYGIISQLQAAPIISQNVLTDMEMGIFCLPTSMPKIRKNSIERCSEEAIFVANGSFPIIMDNNRFKNNRYDVRWMRGLNE